MANKEIPIPVTFCRVTESAASIIFWCNDFLVNDKPVNLLVKICLKYASKKFLGITNIEDCGNSTILIYEGMLHSNATRKLPFIFVS